MQILEQHSELWKLLGKAIVKRPREIIQLLNRHRIFIRMRDDHKELVDGILQGLERNDKVFNQELSRLLSFLEEDQFIGAIAQAVGAVAGAVGSGQQKKSARASANAMQEQARAQTLSSVLAYKAQQDANRLEELKLRQNGKTKQKGIESKTLVIIIGVAVALVIFGMVYFQRNLSPNKIHPVTTNFEVK
jgi:hypothetical protein